MSLVPPILSPVALEGQDFAGSPFGAFGLPSLSTFPPVLFLQADVKLLLGICFCVQGSDSVCAQQQDENLGETTEFFICAL